MLVWGLLGLNIIPALPLASLSPWFPDRSREPLPLPVGLVAQHRPCVESPLAREVGRGLAPDHFIFLRPWALQHWNGMFPGSTWTFQETNILKMLYWFPAKPAQSTCEISPWPLPDQGWWKIDFTSAVLLVFASRCVQLWVCTQPPSRSWGWP